MFSEKEQKSTGLIFHSWGHNIGNKTAAIRDIAALIKHHLSNQPLSLDYITAKLDLITELSSEIANAPLPFITEKIDVNLHMLNLVKKLQLSNRYKDIKFRVELEGNPFVAANSYWLAEVYEELFNNAANAMNNIEDKEITISSRINENNLSIYIKDNGKGIEREQLFNIFKDPPVLRTDGTGRGLYIVRLTIEFYDGHVNVETAPSGTTVTIDIPILGIVGQE